LKVKLRFNLGNPRCMLIGIVQFELTELKDACILGVWKALRHSGQDNYALWNDNGKPPSPLYTDRVVFQIRPKRARLATTFEKQTNPPSEGYLHFTQLVICFANLLLDIRMSLVQFLHD